MKLSLISITFLGLSLTTISYKSKSNDVKYTKIEKLGARINSLNNLDENAQRNNINFSKENALLSNTIQLKRNDISLIEKAHFNKQQLQITSSSNKFDFSQFSNIVAIINKWKKLVKPKKLSKSFKERLKNKNIISKKVKTAISSVLGIGIATIVGFFLIKHSRYLTNKAQAYVADTALKKFLKYKSVDFELEDNFKNLVFNLLWENQYNDRQLVSWSLRKLRDKFLYKKDLPGSDQIKNWLKDFNDAKKLNTVTENPFNYILNMLKGEQGSQIFEVLIKLMKKISEKNDLKTDVISKLGLNDSSDISNLIKSSSENKETLTSTISSLFLSIGPIKYSLEWLIEKGKKAIKNEETQSYLSTWLEFAKVLRKIINKDNFKIKYMTELKVIYDFQANLLNKLIGSTELIDSSLWTLSWLLPEIKYKASDIITPNLIKSWFEDLGSQKQIKQNK